MFTLAGLNEKLKDVFQKRKAGIGSSFLNVLKLFRICNFFCLKLLFLDEIFQIGFECFPIKYI